MCFLMLNKPSMYTVVVLGSVVDTAVLSQIRKEENEVLQYL